MTGELLELPDMIFVECRGHIAALTRDQLEQAYPDVIITCPVCRIRVLGTAPRIIKSWRRDERERRRRMTEVRKRNRAFHDDDV